MRLTLFGKTVRNLRMDFGYALKTMAEFMNISSAHLSSIEYGEKTLNEKHINAALSFFRDKATSEQLKQLRDAGEKSLGIVNTSTLSSDARGLVAAFARRLQEGREPSRDIKRWLDSQQ
jgi:transcriptional regulator with XRE-family HTH domain